MSKKVVEVKLGQLDSASSVLRQLLNEKLPFKASYWMRRNMESIGRVYMPFLEAKTALLKECGEVYEDGRFKTTEDGRNVVLKEDKREGFWKQYNELAAKDVEVEVFPLKLDLFDKVEISIVELESIAFLIEEEVENA